MAAMKEPYSNPISMFLLLLLFLMFHAGESDLRLNYYSKSCPKAEHIIKEEVIKLYNVHGDTAESWIRNIFHDCIVKSCDASLLLDTTKTIVSEKTSPRSFGMRNFEYVNVIKEALENECPMTVSCADMIALSARDGAIMLGVPSIQMKTGRKDSKKSYAAVVEDFLPNHNDSVSLVLKRFQSVGIDVEGSVALLGAHSVGPFHCVNVVNRLYPDIDPTLDHEYGLYLRSRCPSPKPKPNPKEKEYARNDGETPMVINNMYYKDLLRHKGLLLIDQELVSNPITSPFVKKMASDNGYFLNQFSRALLKLSENNPLTGNKGEIRKDCRYVNGG